MVKVDLSIIVPLNKFSKLEQLGLSSIIYQLPNNVQLLLIVNGVSNQLYELVKDYIGEHKSVKYFNLQQANANSARFKGVEEAAGEYVFFHDADDLLLPGTISTLIHYTKKGYDCVCFNIYRNRINDGVISSSELIYTRKKEVLRYWFTSPSKRQYSRYPSHIVNKLIKKELFNDLTMSDSPFFQDWYISYNIANKINSILLSDKLTYIYNNHDTSNSHYASMTVEMLFSSLSVYKMTKRNYKAIKKNELLSRFSSLYFLAWHNRLKFLYKKNDIQHSRFKKLSKIVYSKVNIFAFSITSMEFYTVLYYKIQMLYFSLTGKA